MAAVVAQAAAAATYTHRSLKKVDMPDYVYERPAGQDSCHQV